MSIKENISLVSNIFNHLENCNLPLVCVFLWKVFSHLHAIFTEFLDADHCTTSELLTPIASFQGQFSGKNQRKKHETISFYKVFLKWLHQEKFGFQKSFNYLHLEI